MAVRIFLGFSALLWLPYGVYCFLRPDSLAEAAGVTAVSVTATIELRAMYGGLQAAIGVLATLGLLRPALQRPTLVTLACVYAGLGLPRLLATIMAGEVSAYTGFALALELTSAAFATWCLSQGSAPPAL